MLLLYVTVKSNQYTPMFWLGKTQFSYFRYQWKNCFLSALVL